MQEQKKKALLNFKKACGHCDKIIGMIEKDEYCIDIMQQNLAVIGLLKSAHQMLMEGHLKGCVKTAMDTKNGAKKKKMIEEVLQVTKLYNK